MQAVVFWLTGGAFFALQLGVLLYLLYARPAAGLAPIEGRRRRVEIVWTLVPASLFVAVVLMVSGVTGSAWSRVRGEAASTDVRRGPHRLDIHPASHAVRGAHARVGQADR